MNHRLFFAIQGFQENTNVCLDGQMTAYDLGFSKG